MLRRCFLFIFCLLTFFHLGFGQSDGNSFLITNTDSVGFILDKPWKYHAGDNPEWAKPQFDDEQWPVINPELNLDSIPENLFKGIGWFRLHLQVDSSVTGKPLALVMSHDGASEIYLNGKLLAGFGKPATEPDLEENTYPRNEFTPVVFTPGENIIAVRYSNRDAFFNYKWLDKKYAGFTLTLKEFKKVSEHFFSLVFITFVTLFLSGFLLALSLLHFFLFLFYKAQKSNLYFFLFTLLYSGIFILADAAALNSSPFFINITGLIFSYLIAGLFISLSALIYSIFLPSFPKQFWLILFIGFFAVILSHTTYSTPATILISVLIGISFFECIRILIKSILEKKEGAWIIAIGVLFFILLVSFLGILALFSQNISATGIFGLVIGILSILCLLSIPISMSIYLAYNFSKTNKKLKEQLEKVQELSEKTLQQEKEKKKILETQKEMLEMQVAERTAEVVKQKHEIEEKNKDITDSINYARRIQDAILPAADAFNQLLPESFVLYKPKDIVSGDFYWIEKVIASEAKQSVSNKEIASGTRNDVTLIAAADCTGHGVPGAFMSMIGHNMLNKIAIEKGINKPSEILTQLSSEIRTALKQRGENSESRDGMDIALVSLEFAVNSYELNKQTENTKLKTLKLQYAGAQRPLWIIKDETFLTEIKADKFSIGGLQTHNTGFTNHELDLKKGDTIYLFSDGFTDQFGGEQGKKFMSKRLKELLVSIQHMSMTEQKNHLNKIIEEWKAPANTNKSYEQVDDILVIGIRI